MSPQTTLMMLIWLALSFTLAAASTTYVNPQYLAMNIAPYGTWDQNVPSSITRAPVDEIVATMGSKGQGNRLLAFSTLIYYTQSADATPYPVCECTKQGAFLAGEDD